MRDLRTASQALMTGRQHTEAVASILPRELPMPSTPAIARRCLGMEEAEGVLSLCI